MKEEREIALNPEITKLLKHNDMFIITEITKNETNILKYRSFLRINKNDMKIQIAQLEWPVNLENLKEVIEKYNNGDITISENLGIKKEVDILCKALREDAGYYMSWQANIAMAFKDEYDRIMIELNTQYNKDIIHLVANRAAKNFLNLLIAHKENKND